MPPTARAPKKRDRSRGLRAPIPHRALVASLPFSATLSAGEVAAGIAAGLRPSGCADPDVLALGDDPRGAPEAHGIALEPAGATLELAGFDERMRSARAVILAAARLERERLRGTLELEILTRARQAGVPAYAICGESRLDAFDARLLDLQVVIEARTKRALTLAARRLAPLL